MGPALSPVSGLHYYAHLQLPLPAMQLHVPNPNPFAGPSAMRKTHEKTVQPQEYILTTGVPTTVNALAFGPAISVGSALHHYVCACNCPLLLPRTLQLAPCN